MIKRYIWLINFFAYRLAIAFHYVGRWVLLKISRERFDVNEPPVSRTGVTKCAIIVVYPSKSTAYRKSLRLLLSSLQLEDVHPIIILNGDFPLEGLREIVGEHPVQILSRPNLGRDFSGYAAGIRWLQHSGQYEDLERLYLFNDTLYFLRPPNREISWMSSVDFGCIFMNLLVHSHAQSFALSFSREVLESSQFKSFWHNYVPSDSKFHAIHRGEVHLTTKLLEAGFRASPFVSEKNLIRDLKISEKAIPRIRQLPVGQYFGPFPAPGLLEQHTRKGVKPPARSLVGLKSEEDLRTFFSNFVYQDAPHTIGLHLSALAMVPLKVDSFKFHSTSSIVFALRLTSCDFADDILEDQVHRLQLYMAGSRRIVRLRNLGEL